MKGAEVTRSTPPFRTAWRTGKALIAAGGLYCSLLLVAGRAHEDELRLYAASWALLGFASVLLIDRPDLLRERERRPADALEPTFHFWLMAALVGCNLLAPAIDARCTLTSVHPPAALRWPGAVCVALGGWLTAWAVHANPFYSLYIRNQSTRGHVAVAVGPYAWMRHPGYAGMLLTNLGAPMAGGSYLGLLGALPYFLILFRRTRREDRWAHAELQGYRAYAAAVRWKLVPLVW